MYFFIYLFIFWIDRSMFGSEITLLYAERTLTTGLSMMPLRKMRSRSLAVVELALSLSVSNTCGTAGGKRQRDLITQLLMRYCVLWLTHTVCFILISSHMDDIMSFFKSTAELYLKYEFVVYVNLVFARHLPEFFQNTTFNYWNLTGSVYDMM